MADADDFDVEELRRLLRGDSPQQPAEAPEAAARKPVARPLPKAPGRAGKPAAKAKAKPGGRSKKR